METVEQAVAALQEDAEKSAKFMAALVHRNISFGGRLALANAVEILKETTTKQAAVEVEEKAKVKEITEQAANGLDTALVVKMFTDLMLDIDKKHTEIIHQRDALLDNLFAQLTADTAPQ